jgi:hypothetical protein
MKRLFAYLFKWPLVYTQDHDGEIRLRKVTKTLFGNYTVTGMTGCCHGILIFDGTVSNGAYIKYWIPANKYAKELAMLMKLEK